MTCRELIDFLMDYVSGELSPAEQTTFEKHLAECPDCVAYVTTYQETVKLGKAAYARLDESVPTDVPEELVRAILAARPRGL